MGRAVPRPGRRGRAAHGDEGCRREAPPRHAPKAGPSRFPRDIAPGDRPTMTTELTYLAWTLVLALVYIGLPSQLRTLETGTAYNASARDTAGPPVGLYTGRLQRAQANLFETLPLFIGAVLIAHVAGRTGSLTGWGVALYFWARVVYLPLYALGIPYLRSLVWLASLAGLIMVIVADLHG